MKKQWLVALLMSGFLASVASAINLGFFVISPELGGSVGYKKGDLIVTQNGHKASIADKDHLAYGGYARLWLGIGGLMIAPQVTYEELQNRFNDIEAIDYKVKFGNLQYGGVIGYQIPLINLTPYIGASYSHFTRGYGGDSSLKDTWAVNFGAKLDVPLIPFLTLGINGSWQKTGIHFPGGNDNGHSLDLELLTTSLTLGLAF
ncbi:hypothetical protein BBW65_03725 [Helicobacter enhydrae]|uniref:Outer membrane protein beta-barrel domain-containing protein n=1 Tax=Helicobacter enhydrae TaxID=222136 RepID=A0A1B1U5F5_9HELI|nr:hypothetical protein [Helicobacter enhydrae]ANV97961.1 hypothetical protein BBW65_03725 [Helicobacter enhydrae]